MDRCVPHHSHARCLRLLWLMRIPHPSTRPTFTVASFYLWKVTPRSRKSVRPRFFVLLGPALSQRAHRPCGHRRRCVCLRFVHKVPPLTRTFAAAAGTEQERMAWCTRHAMSTRTRSLRSKRSGSRRKTRACPAPPSVRFHSSRN
jgi:hypothetical protein